LKIAIYARVGAGVPQKDEENLLDIQTNQITDWAKSLGHIIVGQYRDKKASANDMRRPEFVRINHDALLSSHPFDTIVVTSFSRLYRDEIRLAKYKKN